MGIKIAFDTELIRPGCSLLQATYGGSMGIEDLFDSTLWITHPTPGMKVYNLTSEELWKLVQLVEATHRGNTDEDSC